MKLGIHNDLAAVLGEVEHLSARSATTPATSATCGRRSSAPRVVDLDGNAAGSVDAEQAANAQRSLAGIRANATKQKAAKQEAAAEQKH